MSVISLHMAADCTSSSGHMIPYSSHPRSCTSRSDLWGSNMMLFGVTKRTPLTIPWKTEQKMAMKHWFIHYSSMDRLDYHSKDGTYCSCYCTLIILATKRPLRQEEIDMKCNQPSFWFFFSCAVWWKIWNQWYYNKRSACIVVYRRNCSENTIIFFLNVIDFVS